VLEWGCGVARITRHLPAQPGIGHVTGADIHKGMIDWNRKHIPNVEFVQISEDLPTQLPSNRFDAVIGVSVLTHIPADQQLEWLKEIKRWLKPQGVWLFTTHGTAFHKLLSARELQQLQKDGCITQSYPQSGHRMMTTVHEANLLRKWLTPNFDIVEHTPGESNTEAAGGHDLWIVRKKA
jgi:ubiquinone/menaquinone biosynthesis C-methylase UbiE